MVYNTTHPTPEFAVTTVFIEDEVKTRNSWKMKNHCYHPLRRASEISHGRRATKFRQIHRNYSQKYTQ